MAALLFAVLALEENNREPVFGIPECLVKLNRRVDESYGLVHVDNTAEAISEKLANTVGPKAYSLEIFLLEEGSILSSRGEQGQVGLIQGDRIAVSPGTRSPVELELELNTTA
jgi:hypothetical protein